MKNRSLPAALVVLFASAPALAGESFEFGFGPGGGLSLQSDQYVAGLHVVGRHARLRFVELDLGAAGGLGADFYSLRPALHARAVLDLRGIRLYPVVGPSMYAYWPRAAFAKFCRKAEMDCTEQKWGLDLGLGLGWRWLAAEACLGTGDLPLWTFAVTATVWP